MVVIDRAPAGLGKGWELEAPYSRSMAWPDSKKRIARAKTDASGWTTVTQAPTAGLGALSLSTVPTWAWFALGMVVAGGVVYAVVR